MNSIQISITWVVVLLFTRLAVEYSVQTITAPAYQCLKKSVGKVSIIRVLARAVAIMFWGHKEAMIPTSHSSSNNNNSLYYSNYRGLFHRDMVANCRPPPQDASSADDPPPKIRYVVPRVHPEQRDLFYRDETFSKVGRKHMEVFQASGFHVA